MDPGLLGADLFLGIRTTAIVERSWVTLFERLIAEICGANDIFETLSGCTKRRFIHITSKFFDAT